MKKDYVNKTPSEILSMLTLKRKVAQTIVPAYFNYAQGREALKNGVGGLWPVLHAKSTGAEFAADMDELHELADIPLFQILFDM